MQPIVCSSPCLKLPGASRRSTVGRKEKEKEGEEKERKAKEGKEEMQDKKPSPRRCHRDQHFEDGRCIKQGKSEESEGSAGGDGSRKTRKEEKAAR